MSLGYDVVKVKRRPTCKSIRFVYDFSAINFRQDSSKDSFLTLHLFTTWSGGFAVNDNYIKRHLIMAPEIRKTSMHLKQL